jgi:hypothetical protein
MKRMRNVTLAPLPYITLQNTIPFQVRFGNNERPRPLKLFVPFVLQRASSARCTTRGPRGRPQRGLKTAIQLHSLGTTNHGWKRISEQTSALIFAFPQILSHRAESGIRRAETVRFARRGRAGGGSTASVGCADCVQTPGAAKPRLRVAHF